MKIRIVGTEAELADAAERIGLGYEVVETSRPYPRRDGSQVSVYLEVRLPSPAPAPIPGTIVRVPGAGARNATQPKRRELG